MGKTDSSRLFRPLGAVLLIILVVIGGGISAGRLGQRETRRPSVRQASAHAAEFPVLFYSGSTSKKRDGGIVARGKGLRARFAPTSVVFEGRQGQVKLEFIGSSAVTPGGENGRGCLNILHGDDPSGWRVGMPIYTGVAYRNIYPGIDLKYHDTAGRLESDYVVSPSANPSAIRFRYAQPSKIRLGNGALTVSLHRDLITEAPPAAFQMKNGKRAEVKAGFHLFADGSVGFDVGAYDKSTPLIIDPVVTFSTFWGGVLDDGLTGVAVGSDGSIFVSGWTESSDVPTVSAVQPNLASPTDAFVMKLSASNTIVYATYLGGTGTDRANGIAVDSAGYAYVTGYTSSHDFPVVTPFQGYLAGMQNAFVAKLSPSGTALAYSTYLGGGRSDMANAIQVDSSGSAYVAGQTTSLNFPVANPYQSATAGGQDAFVAKLNPGGNTLAYSTYIGGNGTDAALGLAVWNGQAYITGATDSFNFPHLNAFQAWSQGGQDAFVTALNSAGNGLVYSTYLGGSGGTPGQPEMGYGIAVDATGSAYVVGTTPSFNFPVSSAVQNQISYGNDAFITRLNPAGNTIAFSSYLGGSSYDAAMAVTLDSAGNAYITGYTASPDFPLMKPMQTTNQGNYDAFVTSVNPAGNLLRFSTYWGGPASDSPTSIALDTYGNPIITGQTLSSNFPLFNPLQNSNGGSMNGFLMRLTTVDLLRFKVAVFSAGQWYLDSGGNFLWNGHGTGDPGSFGGGPNDIPVVGDWDGTGWPRIGIYRQGIWYLDMNGDFQWDYGDWACAFGSPSDIPVVGDWNGNGRSKIGTYRAGIWYLDYNGDCQWDAGDRTYAFGSPWDIPVVGDWDGSGRSKIGTYRQGTWYLDFSGDFQWGAGDRAYAYGAPTDIPVVGDWDGSGRSKIGTYRQGTFYLDYNGDFQSDAGDRAYWFGAPLGYPLATK